VTAKLRQISRIWIWWVAGGCALLLVIGMGGAIWGVVSLIKTVNSIGPVPSNCLPSDFPGYPGASVGDVSEFTGAGAPRGYSEECQMTFESNDDSATVRDFYASRLNSGDWAVTSNDGATGKIKFRRVSRPVTVGALDISSRGQHTAIQVTIDS